MICKHVFINLFEVEPQDGFCLFVKASIQTEAAER